MININNNAIFIADSHYPHHNSKLLETLNYIDSQKIITQIFLMGDIFDLLIGNNQFLYNYSKDIIELINKLSNKIDVYYLEGNHDFLLKKYFSNVKIFSRSNQPVKCQLNNKVVFLSHGDKYETGILYEIYTKIIRNQFSLWILRPFVNKIINILRQKNICYKNNKKLIAKIKLVIEHYPRNSMIIEGHFHQGIIVDNYISLPSLICQKQVGIVKDKKIIFVTYKSLTDQF